MTKEKGTDWLPDWLTDWPPVNMWAFTPSLVSLWGTSTPQARIIEGHYPRGHATAGTLWLILLPCGPSRLVPWTSTHGKRLCRIPPFPSEPQRIYPLVLFSFSGHPHPTYMPSSTQHALIPFFSPWWYSPGGECVQPFDTHVKTHIHIRLNVSPVFLWHLTGISLCQRKWIIFSHSEKNIDRESLCQSENRIRSVLWWEQTVWHGGFPFPTLFLSERV